MEFSIPNHFQSLLSKICKEQDFQKLQYYVRSMKKAPHGGVFHNQHPGIFLSYYPCETELFLNPNMKVPFPIKRFTSKAREIVESEQIENEDLLSFCFGVNRLDKHDRVFGDQIAGVKLYTAMVSRALSLKNNVSLEFQDTVMRAAYGEIRFTDYFDVDYDKLLIVFTCLILRLNLCRFIDLCDVYLAERLIADHDKYGLTDISAAQFERQGFCIGNTYYLYNIFFDTSINHPAASVPKTIEIFRSIDHANIFMRCDETLAIPTAEKVCTASMDMQRWRGITLNMACIENQIISGKEIIVHYDSDTFNKLLLVVKPDSLQGNSCIQISVEQLWNPDRIIPGMQTILTNYIHGCYFPDSKTLDHVDFSINQYNRQLYSQKYQDAVTTTLVPIDQYADLHYKVWCIRGSTITMENWAELVLCTLDDPFRELFAEAIGATIDVQ